MGWVNSIVFLISFSLALTFGVFLIIKSRKVKSRILLYYGLTSVTWGLSFIAWIIDIFTIFITGGNINMYPNYIIPIIYISGSFAAITSVFGILTGTEVIKSKIKWIYVSIAIIFNNKLPSLYGLFLFSKVSFPAIIIRLSPA